jgi:general secretion pathway protein N
MLMDNAVAARLPVRRRAVSQQSMAGNRTDMVKWPKILGVALLPAGMLLSGLAPLPAATSATSDILSDRPGEADTVDIGSVKPLTRPNLETAKPVPAGNPLWSVPLSVLTATQERPIFLASRRPPQRAVVAPPLDEANVPVAQKAAEPDRSPLALIGAVVGDSDAIAIFLDRTNQKIVRLRQGETHAGWVLSSVQGREVTLKKADRTETLALKGADAPPGPPVLPMPTAIGGAADGSYAPFVPRSTPKNGEPDGL